MSTVELRYLARHPGAAVRNFGFQFAVAAALAGKAAATRNAVFAQVPGYEWWPWLLAGMSALILVSIVVPMRFRLNALIGALLAGVAALRITTYIIGVFFLGLEGAAVAIASYMICLWSIVAAVGITWDRLTFSAGLQVAVEAGEDAA